MNANVNEVKPINCQESFCLRPINSGLVHRVSRIPRNSFSSIKQRTVFRFETVTFFRTPTELWMENNNAVLFSRSLLLYPLFSPLWKKKMLNAFLQLLRWRDPNSRPIIRPTGVTTSRNLGRKIRRKKMRPSSIPESMTFTSFRKTCVGPSSRFWLRFPPRWHPEWLNRTLQKRVLFHEYLESARNFQAGFRTGSWMGERRK